jgi:hypothetical protein
MEPDFFVDDRYMLFAVGLLTEVCPTVALKIMKRHLRRVRETEDI